MIRVLIADASERIVGNLSRRLEVEEDIKLVGTAADGEHAVQEALRAQPDVAVIDAALPVMDGVQTTEMLAQYVPRTGVILMSLDSESDLFRRAMLAGAREVLQKPFKGDDLVEAIHRIHGVQTRKRAAAEPQDPAAASGGAAPGGRLFTVVAAKGGVGTSFIATNLAALYAQQRPGRVAIVDLSLQYGDVAAMLDVKTSQTIADLAAHDAVADPDLIAEVLADGPGGVHVLAAPASPELADYVTIVHLRALLDALRRTHDIVIADTATQLSEITLEAVERADRVVLVTDYSVTGVKNTRLLTSVLEVLHIPDERCALVVNRRDPATSLQLDRKQTEEFLSLPVSGEIPHDAASVGASVSRGLPLAIGAAQSPVVPALKALAELLDTGAAPDIEAASGAARRKRRTLFGR